MPLFEFSHWDGSQEFSPQSADKLFDQISRYLLEYGDQTFDLLEQLEQERPELLDSLVRYGYVERDEEGRFQIAPKGVRRVESRALDDLFQVTRKDKSGRHETPHRGSGQTLHEEWRPYEYGDPVAQLNLHETLKQALLRQGGGTPVEIAEEDLVVYDTEHQTSCATVLLVDM